MTQYADQRTPAAVASKPHWTATPYVIHLNADPSSDVSAASDCGALVRTLPLAGLRTPAELDERATEIFEFPMPPGGISSMTSWLSDLEWLDVEAGVLFVIDASEARPKVAEAMLDMLPFLIAWWQLWPQQTAAHVVNVADVKQAVGWLERGNDRIEGRAVVIGTAPASRIPIAIGR